MSSTTTPQSRRAVLLGWAAGGVAALAGALARPTAADAANGAAVTGGATLTGTSSTVIDTSASAVDAFWGTAGSGHGLVGLSSDGDGVKGYALGAGAGVWGDSVSGAGVTGTSADGAGVTGTTGVVANAPGSSGSGVYGAASGPTGTGVFGWCEEGYGIGGVATIGGGARGVATSGIGVEGSAESGTGTGGYSVSGIGVEALSTTGTALKVTGKAHLNRSGRRLAAKGLVHLDIPVAGGVTATTLCFANLSVYRAGVHIAAVRPAVASTASIRVYFNVALPASTYVSWFVLD